jgi:hypothetical protein
MRKLRNYFVFLILFFIIGFNLWLNFPETQILADPNDNIFQYSLILRTNWIWENYGCPLSLSCLSNLVDHNVTAWAEGYPLPFYYSHIPQIATVSTFHLLIKPIVSIFNLQFSIYNYYNWTKYLLYTLFPIPVFLALRFIGFNPIISAIGAFFSSHLSTDGLYGIDPVSNLWRGYGLTSQLYALFFLPLAIAFVYRLLSFTSSSFSLKLSLDSARNRPRLLRSLMENNLLLAVLFLTLTTAGHLGIGVLGILSTIPFLFFDLKPQNLFLRGKKLFFVICSLLFILSYWIIPLLLNNNYHIISFWDPIWKFDSYGWFEAVRQFFMGEIFDWQRSFPVITMLTIIGFFALLIKDRNLISHPELVSGSNQMPKPIRQAQGPEYIERQVRHDNLYVFSLLFAFWFMMYFGRTTWGSLIDLIPNMKDFHQHRFIVAVHMAAIFLIPAGIEYLIQIIKKVSNLISNIFAFLPISLGEQRNREIIQNITFYILSFTFISIVAYFTMQRTLEYTKLNNQWIGEANRAYQYNEKNFQNLVSYLKSLPSARLYAGRPGNWGHDFRLGSTQMYMLFGVNGFDMSQFLPETWSPLSENEQNFDERVAEDYDLLNIRYVVSDKNHDFTPKASLEEKFGPFELYQVSTTGWFDVVESPMFVKSDKTNFINIVHYWHRSYPRRYKMHPLISVEKNPTIPQGMQRVFTMTDEVSYTEGDKDTWKVAEGLLPGGGTDKGPQKNIFSDYPFVFPEATVSGKIKEERVEKQTYSATVEVPQNCTNCMVMFKMSYHPNWQTKIDGQSASKFAVFPFYLAVQASPGTHTVEFTYQPNRLKIAIILAELLFTLLILFRKKLIILFRNYFTSKTS